MKYENKPIRVPEKSSEYLLLLWIYLGGLAFLLYCIIIDGVEMIPYCLVVLEGLTACTAVLFDLQLIEIGKEMKAIGYPEGKKWHTVGVLSLCLSPLYIPNIFTMVWYYKTNITRKYAIAHNTAVEHGIYLELERKEAANIQRSDDRVAEAVVKESQKHQPQGNLVSRPDAPEKSPQAPTASPALMNPVQKVPVKEQQKAPAETKPVLEEAKAVKKTVSGKLDWK